MDRKEELVNLLNEVFKNLEPISYDDFNQVFKPKTENSLIELEAKYPKLGIKNGNLTVISLIATITDILCDERLAFAIHISKPDKIQGEIAPNFSWYKIPR